MLAVAAAATIPLSAARGAFPGRPGLIVYDDSSQSGGPTSESNCGNSFVSIRTMRADGSHRKYLARGNNPAYSPNGQLVVYSTCDGIESDLMIMGADGGGAHAVLDTTANEDQPFFSANGKRIFFIRDGGGKGYGDVYSVSAKGNSPKRLTHTGGEVGESSPQAAANGRFVAFERSGRIFTMRPDGSSEKPLVNGFDPAISPNSRRVAYAHRGQIYLVGSEGGNPHPLTHFKNKDELNASLSPAFSPNGRWVVFAVERCVSYGPGCRDSQRLMKVRTRGGKPKALTSTKVGGFHPDWQPRS